MAIENKLKTFMNIKPLSILILASLIGVVQSVSASDRCYGEDVRKNFYTPQPGLVLLQPDPIPTMQSTRRYIADDSCWEGHLRKLLESHPEKPFVLFVHGRGAHPWKEKRENLMGMIARQHDVSVAMFTWKSKSRRFPADRAIEASVDLNKLLTMLFSARATTKFEKPITILAHSMGAIVLQHAVHRSKYTDDISLADNIILNAAAVPSQRHSKWVQALKVVNRVYVVSNNGDLILRGMDSGPARERGLGRTPVKPDGIDPHPYKLAGNATYLDLSAELGLDHRYFVVQPKYEDTCRPGTKRFFYSAMRGESPDWNHFKKIDVAAGEAYAVEEPDC